MKNHENLNSHGKKQNNQQTPRAKLTQMLELSDKDFKAAIIQ